MSESRDVYTMNEDDELAGILGGPTPQEDDGESSHRVKRTLRRTNASLGQQQTLGFLLIKLWVTVAKVLAPVFAALANKHAQSLSDKNQNSDFSGEKNGHS